MTAELCESVRRYDHPRFLLLAVRHLLVLESLAAPSTDALRLALLQFERELTSDPFFEGAAHVDRIASAMRVL